MAKSLCIKVLLHKKCDSGGTQTRDTQNRNLMLYSTELRSLMRYKVLRMKRNRHAKLQ